MRMPIQGLPVSYSEYFKGDLKSHVTGILGGIIWCIGMSFSIIASDKAGPAISYGLGQLLTSPVGESRVVLRLRHDQYGLYRH